MHLLARSNVPRVSTKTEFPEVYHLKMIFADDLLRSTVIVEKLSTSKKRMF